MTELPTTPDSTVDSAFPFWSPSVAAEFRSLVRQAFADRQIAVSVHADHVADPAGRQYGLANLSAVCRNNEGGTQNWPEIISRFVASATASAGQPNELEHWSAAEILASTYCRVMPAADVHATMTYGSVVAPGLVQVFNLDLPETVRFFTDENVARCGVPALMEAGMQNLSSVHVDERRTLGNSDSKIEILWGESYFIASLILILDEVLARYGHRLDPEVGAFVAVPTRDLLAYHVLQDANVVHSLQRLAHLCVAEYSDGPGQLSPSVYWWRPGVIERVSALTDDGLEIEVGADLAQVLNRLTSS
jgi:hypothetical protein